MLPLRSLKNILVMTQVMAQDEYGKEAFLGFQIFDNEGKDKAGVIDRREDWTGNTGECSTGNRTAPKHKTSHLRFLIWVAFVRKQSSNIGETERRTCPLKGCPERPFETTDAMLEHVYTCPRLEKNGLYECCDCKKEERVSKCHTNGCREPSPFSTVTNSFRRAKRFLSSHHGAKNPHGFEKTIRRLPAPQELVVELPTPDVQLQSGHSDPAINPTSFATEMDTTWRENPHVYISEIYGSERPAEFPVDDNTYLQFGGLQPKVVCSELCAGYDSACNPRDQPRYEDVPAGLEPAWPIADHGHRQDALQWVGSPLRTGDISELAHQGYPSPMQVNDEHLPIQDFESFNDPYVSYGNTSFHGLQSPLVSPISEHDYRNSFPPTTAGSRTNTDVSAISMSSNTSYSHTSMSSLDSICSRVQNYEKPPARFFEEGPDLMFSEPDSMEEPVQPAELPTSSNSYAPKSTLGHSSPQIFTLKESFVNPAQLSTPIMILGQGHHTQNHVQDAAKVFHPQSTGLGARAHAESLPQPLTSMPSPSSPPPIVKSFPSKYKCHCGFEPRGKEIYKGANFKRHQETTKCRRYSPYPLSETKSYQCLYPDCGKSYGRSDNLRAHQKTKAHLLVLQLTQFGSFSQHSGIDAEHDMLERHHYQGIETHGGSGSNYFR